MHCWSHCRQPITVAESQIHLEADIHTFHSIPSHCNHCIHCHISISCMYLCMSTCTASLYSFPLLHYTIIVIQSLSTLPIHKRQASVHIFICASIWGNPQYAIILFRKYSSNTFSHGHTYMSHNIFPKSVIVKCIGISFYPFLIFAYICPPFAKYQSRNQLSGHLDLEWVFIVRGSIPRYLCSVSLRNSHHPSIVGHHHLRRWFKMRRSEKVRFAPMLFPFPLGTSHFTSQAIPTHRHCGSVLISSDLISISKKPTRSLGAIGVLSFTIQRKGLCKPNHASQRGLVERSHPPSDWFLSHGVSLQDPVNATGDNHIDFSVPAHNGNF